MFFLSSSKSFRRHQIELFLRLEQMEKAGVPILEALDAAREDAPTRYLRRVAEGMTAAIRGGSTLSESMALYPRLFDETTVAVIALGEKTGRVGRMLEKCRKHFKDVDDHKFRMRRATRGPIISGMIVLVLAALRTDTFLPKAVLLLAFMVSVTLLGRRVSQVFRHFTDYLTLGVPRAGTLVMQNSYACFSESLATLFESGLDLRGALVTAAETAPNLVVRDSILRAAAEVAGGKSLYKAFREEGEMDGLALAMIKAGEDSGNLAATLRELAGHYDRQTEAALTAVEQLSGPLLTLMVSAAFYLAM